MANPKNRIQAVRRARGWTAADLAEQTGGEVSVSGLRKVEQGDRSPSLKTALILARTLNTTVEDLFPPHSHRTPGA